METAILIANHQPSIIQRLLAALVPVLLIAMGYIDPGKWAAAAEGGARFGSDLVLLMLLFNFAAILCQYLSARISLVTGRNLSQICSEEYDKSTCIFLGVLTEVSMFTLDLNMILGTAHGFNLLFGADLLTCVFLTAISAAIYPLFAILFENGKTKLLCILMATCTLLFYVLGFLFSQPEISISASGMLTKLNGESAFALMSLLGANIMPHNFYLHSSIVQQEQGLLNVSKSLLCHDHFVAILCVFSGMFLVNYVLMNAAANVFYSTGLVQLTFQDTLSLMDQVFKNSTVLLVFLLFLFLSSQISAYSWDLGRQAVLLDFFGLEIPGWLHHATIRVIAIIPALFCVWNSGAEGIFQLLIFTQVVVALVLPSSVIPLFRVASSRSVMGVYKISQFVEFLGVIMFIGILGLKIIFLIEMIFGNSDWVGNFRWNGGSMMSVSYIVLLITAFTSLFFMLWLAATPLRSASSQFNASAWNWDIKDRVSAEREGTDFIESRHEQVEFIQEQESALAAGKSFESNLNMSASTDLNLPETLLDSDNVLHMTNVEETGPAPNVMQLATPVFDPEESASTAETDVISNVCSEGSFGEVVDTAILKVESTGLVEKTFRAGGDLQTRNEEGNKWEPEESLKGVSQISPSLTSEGPCSYRSLSGKSDDSGNGTGSLSRLAGLGRSARRQFAAFLDEFWGQLFDFHGHPTEEARAKKLNILLGIDSKVEPTPAASLKVDNSAREFTGYLSSMSEGGSDSPTKSSVYNSLKLLGVQGSMGTPYGIQRGPSSSWSGHMHHLLDAYLLNSGHNTSGEKRYSSLRFPPSSGGSDHQPLTTVHGYQLTSYPSRIAKETRPDYLTCQTEALCPKSPSLSTSYYKDPLTFSLGRKPKSGLSTMTPPGFSTPSVSRNTILKSERQFAGLTSPIPAENLNSAANEKKFRSLPDISGLSLPYRNSYLAGRSSQLDSACGYGPSLYSTTSLKAGTTLKGGNLSPSEPYTSQFRLSSDTGSLWSTQPSEEFGVANTAHTFKDEGAGDRQSSVTSETASLMDMEAKLLRSFRNCVMKLLKLEGSDWLFRQNDGVDEDLIDRVAAREKFLYEAETREMNLVAHVGESQSSFDRKPVSSLKNDDTDNAKFLVSSVHCGEGCVWRVDLIISFGVWCIHRILELSLIESRPELWGKYTYVLNRLQGIIDLAFFKPRTPMAPCLCLQIPGAHQQRSSPPISNGSLPPPAEQGRGKCTTAAMLLDIIKNVEIEISGRKGRTGTAAGDVAFPKGKENLASVLKRYKRWLSNKPVSSHEGGSGSRKVNTQVH
ncbi:ethylene-insensitive protein 2-like isoform X2 [Diospyros lotus]|uniref:ethylene-insensitive protein 2-like isoform X2 n=1 Tax=Diospyros lotus TaxID=55363 RepID=UPI00224DDFB2|nr:ethylene-insensitive protein 2-like isoform X2 [Diospyros lotus]